MTAKRLPAGLYECSECGAVRGTTATVTDWGPAGERSTCLCEGMVCSRCGLRKRRRPISDYYDPEDGRWWHVPYFMGLVRYCGDCRDDLREADPES